MQLSMLVRSLIVCLCLGLIGCGKVPTWGELTGQTPAAAPPPTSVPHQPVAPVAQVAAPAPASPAEVIGRFQSLRPADITDVELQKLTSLNEGLEQVTEINATGSALLTNAAFNGIEKLTNLQQLNLSATRIGDDACAKIALLSSLEILTLSNTTVSQVGIAAISSMPNLKQLELNHCQLTENACSAIGNLPALKALAVDGCAIDGRKLALICNAKTLTQFKMPRNPINDLALGALQKLSDLEYLELGETQVTGMGLSIAQKGGLKHLKFLGMYSCPLNAQGAKAISSIKSLERISLGNIPILSDEDFANIAQGMKNLQYVISGTMLEPHWCGLDQIEKLQRSGRTAHQSVSQYW